MAWKLRTGGSWGRWVLMVVSGLTVLAACSSDPTEVIQAGTGSEDGSEQAAESGASPAPFDLSGSSWIVETIDGEPVEQSLTMSFFGTPAELNMTVVSDCGSGTGTLTRSGSGYRIERFVWTNANCDPLVDVISEGSSFMYSVEELLTVRANDRVLVARHFVSESETGPIPPETTNPPRGRIDRPSPPPPLIPEATNIPFPECSTLENVGPPTGDRLIELTALRQDLESAFGNIEYVNSMGGPQSVYGVISVGLSHRFQPSIDWIAELAGPEDLCLELPPVGYYDQEPELVPWVFLDDTQNFDDFDGDRFVAVLDRQCGLIDATRLLEPIVEFRDDVVLIGIPIRVATWGPTIVPCYPPDQAEIELDEPLNGRPIQVMTQAE